MKRYTQIYPLVTLGIIIGGLTNAYALIGVDASSDATVYTPTVSVDASTSLKVDEQSTAQATTTQGTSSASLSALETVTTSGAIALPAVISSQADLENYKTQTIRGENHIDTIDTSNPNEVSVSWKQDGKLLGVIPVTVISTTHAVVSNDGTVSVTTDVPWWSSLVSGISIPSKESETEIKESQAMKAYAASTTDLNAKATLLYELITNLEANATVQTSGSATVY